MVNSIESKTIRNPMTMGFDYVDGRKNGDLLNGMLQKVYSLECLFVRKGALKIRTPDRDSTVEPGAVQVFCPGMVYGLTKEGEETADFGLVRMDPEQVSDFPFYTPGFKTILQDAVKQHMPMRFSPAEAEKQNLIPLLESAAEECRSQSFGWDMMAWSYLNLLCMSLTRIWWEQGLQLSFARSTGEPIDSITAYINRHVQDNLRVEELATMCRLSYPWFAKKFREQYGISCKEYIEQVRIEQVEQYLVYTDWDLSEISKATGYADCSHMIKNFKRLKDVTPGQYRASRKAQR